MTPMSDGGSWRHDDDKNVASSSSRSSSRRCLVRQAVVASVLDRRRRMLVSSSSSSSSYYTRRTRRKWIKVDDKVSSVTHTLLAAASFHHSFVAMLDMMDDGPILQNFKIRMKFYIFEESSTGTLIFGNHGRIERVSPDVPWRLAQL
jgi:hypothetical protein